jgi:signal transduction histidine kinase
LLYAVTNQLAIAIDQAELYAQTRAAAFAAQAQAQQLNQTLQALRQTQAKMIQNEKMSSLGQLVAGIAHEINNPVGFVSGNLTYADTYFKDLVGLLNLYQKHYPEPNPEIQTYIDDIDLEFLLGDYASLLDSMKIGTERISKIVLSLRNFSRLDEAEVKAVDLHQGIDSTLLILQNRLKARASSPAINVVKNYGTLPLIDCYASQLNQVFLNLLSNAIDALQDRPEPCTITITTGVRSACSVSDIETKDDNFDTDAWVVVRIKDNGSGMPEDVRQKIFDPFFTTKPVGQGTGLGLSISHQIIVEKHHGWLTCESEPDQGTEFIIEIPAHLPSSG